VEVSNCREKGWEAPRLLRPSIGRADKGLKKQNCDAQIRKGGGGERDTEEKGLCEGRVGQGREVPETMPKTAMTTLRGKGGRRAAPCRGKGKREKT